jgi:hypothetical protein
MASAGRVLVLELNEITWDLLDPLMKEGRLPNFSRLVREGARADAWADEKDGHLDPWVTWTTVYTGVPQHVHGLSMLEQNRETLGARRVWEYAEEAGRRLGMFGSANTWPPQSVDGFWVPGSFARDFQTYPRELEPIQALNVGLVRGHTAGLAKPSIKALLPKLMALGLTIGTGLRCATTMLQAKLTGKGYWKFPALQPVMNFDLFAKLYRENGPDFATFHSNHVAYYMHRFWRAMDPSAFDVPPPPEEVETYGGAVRHGYEVADELVGKLRRLAGQDVHFVVLSSCGQQPATGGRYSEDQRRGHVGLQIKIEKLLEEVDVKQQVEFSNLMAPQWKVDFPNEALLETTVRRLREALNTTKGTEAFAVSIEGLSICLGAHRNQDLDDSLEIPGPDGARAYRAGDLLDKHSEVVKSGRHHPKGVLIMQGPKVPKGADLGRCDNLDIAPTLMTLLGLPVPAAMQGRVLLEPTSSRKRERALAGVA